MWSSARAAIVVVGSVVDAVTATPVSGAELSIANGGVLLGRGASDATGQFRLVFELANRPEAQNLKLAVRRANYIETTDDVTVTSGRTDRGSYRIVLLPVAVADCRRLRDHTVVVGYFRPPSGAPAGLELAARIKDTLDYDLLTRFQQLRIRPDSQPLVIACEKVKPQALADYASYAKALQADAFLSGYVAPTGVAGSQKVKVEMSIGDRFGLLVPLAHASTPNVDLDDPAAARLHADAHAAIFTALIAGYEKTGQATECVEATIAAERAIGALPATLADARKRCQKRLPNSGLLPGGSR